MHSHLIELKCVCALFCCVSFTLVCFVLLKKITEEKEQQQAKVMKMRQKKINRNHIVNNIITYCLITNNLHIERRCARKGQEWIKRLTEKKKCRLNYTDVFWSFCIIEIVQMRLLWRLCVRFVCVSVFIVCIEHCKMLNTHTDTHATHFDFRDRFTFIPKCIHSWRQKLLSQHIFTSICDRAFRWHLLLSSADHHQITPLCGL